MNGVQTQSGHSFTPFNLWSVRTVETEQDEPICTLIDLDPLLHTACKLESARFLTNAGDAEGIKLSSRSPSPLTPLPSNYESHEEHASLLLSHSLQSGSGANPNPHHGETSTAGASGSIEKRRKRVGANNHHSRRCIEKATSGHAPQSYAAEPSMVEALTRDTEPIQLDVDASALPSLSSSSWIGRRTKEARTTPWTPEELIQLGFTEIVWDGSCISPLQFKLARASTQCWHRKMRLITDVQKRIIAVLVGHPDDPLWSAVEDDAAALMEEVRTLGLESDAFDAKYIAHQRGDFVAIPVGVSYGGSGMKLGNLVHTKARQRLIQRLLDSPSIQRIASFQSSAFAPKLYRYVSETLAKLFNHQTSLVHNFSNSIFPAASFNCGPTTVSLKHVDSGNLSHNFCPLTALGTFDHTKGGHAILFNLKLFIQFPSGSTILIPSACVGHSNTPVQEGETQLSIAQYASGGLFRWVAYRFKSAKVLLKTTASRSQKAEIDEAEGVRWAKGLAMFSTVDGLKEDLKSVFCHP